MKKTFDGNEVGEGLYGLSVCCKQLKMIVDGFVFLIQFMVFTRLMYSRGKC